MESVGKFEFNRKDLIGHGAFAVVFKGRHKEKRDWVVAVKCINKKNLAKSQSLLGKEIKILKELKHENIVRLLDYQEMGGCVYLVMEYCNGGDLAEYLHSKGTLSEDTIRVFLQQIGQAMTVLQSKGILHRDLKPQNILLCHPEGRRSTTINTCLKIADFGFARHLQTNTMAATLCGSPMYMAPEVIMSQNYDAKADLWSIGTIVYQCLTGKAPFYASTPQELRLFYESNRTLLPSIPKETSSNLRHLLLGLLQRNHKERIGFDEFFHHPFLETSSSTKKCKDCILFVAVQLRINKGAHSDGEMHRLPPKAQYSPTQDTPGFLLKDIANQDSRNTSSYTEDYVMVPAQFLSKTCKPPSIYICNSFFIVQVCLHISKRSLTISILLLCSEPVAIVRKCSPSVPIPVPTQIQNYQRIEQNLQPVGIFSLYPYSPLPDSRFNGLIFIILCTLVGMTPKTSEQILPLSTRTGLLAGSPDMQDASSPKVKMSHGIKDTVRCLINYLMLSMVSVAVLNVRSLSAGKLSDMLLKAAFGAHLFEEGSDESLNCEKSMDTAGSPSYINSAWNSRLLRVGSRRNSETEAMDATPHSSLVFHPPELPEDTLMEQTHTDALSDLRFTLAFVLCVMELASSKDSALDAISSPDVSFLEQSLVTDQISLLSKEWSYAEQLVLYMKAEEFLSSALHNAKETIKQGRLLPSATVKQVLRKLNELYKSCVTYCRTLNHRLQTFLLDKQKLMDRFNGLTADKLIYSHTVHMVQCAALDEMFHYGTASVQRYHKALLLMEGLSRIITEQKDIDSIDKCKQCIERRLSALQS
uniref:non-specific serine/threonine protein kinase n=1 Tax=Sander lucioperca TaxID=283035 RepID=A0A8D0CQM0_SANLU